MKHYYTDQMLITQFLATRQDRLFTQLYERYQVKVYASCLRLMGDEAEAQDQTQEIFCKVHDRLHTFRGEASFSTWLFVLTRFHCLSAIDRLKKHKHLPLGAEHELLYQDSQEALHGEERWQQAEAALHHLPDREQRLLQQHYVGSASVAELARENQVSVSAIKMRLKRARDQARLVHRDMVLNLN